MTHKNFKKLLVLFLATAFMGAAACSKDDTPDDSDSEVTEFTYETFEGNVTKNYDVDTTTFVKGDWILNGAITANTAADLFTGEQGLRLQGKTNNETQKGVVEMNFDIADVKAICISYGIYPAQGELANTNPTTVDIEVSTDGGATYSLLKTETVDIIATKLMTDTVSITHPDDKDFRFRIVNSSMPLDNGNLPRICLDDFGFQN